MIRFEVGHTIGQKDAATDLIYDEAGRSFLVRPTAAAEVYSVLVNDLEIHVDDQDRVVYVDGFAPREAWRASVALPPAARNGEIRVRKSIDLKRGESTRLRRPQRSGRATSIVTPDGCALAPPMARSRHRRS